MMVPPYPPHFMLLPFRAEPLAPGAEWAGSVFCLGLQTISLKFVELPTRNDPVFNKLHPPSEQKTSC